jgi:cytochrome c
LEPELKRIALLYGLVFCIPFIAAAAPVSPSPQVGASLAAEAEVEANKTLGLQTFRQRCQTCHSVEPGARSLLGPNLYGVFNRAAGTSEFRYSPALKQSGLTWTRKNLDKFIASPMKAVPGARMAVGLPSAEQRAAVIDYLSKTGS